MQVFEEVSDCLTDILDLDPRDVTPETYVVRDLDAESIDLLELSVALNSRFKMEIDDDEIFLKSLRYYIDEAEKDNRDVADYISKKFPSLPEDRITEILLDIHGGPVLKVRDLVSYVERNLNGK